jgi:hypothetical protein
MGDSLSTYNEWIELYNDGDMEQNLSGWTIGTTDGKFSAALSKTIQPKGYFLLEHVKADAAKSTASDVLSYTGTYFNNNGGIILQLKNGDIEIDTIDAMEKWPAGNPDKSKEQTMQWDGSKWVTAPATKKTAYVSGSALSDMVTDSTTDTNTDTPSSHLSASDTSAHVSPLPLSNFSQKQELYISAGRNRTVAVGNPVIFEAYAIDAKGVKVQNVSSVWSFGDGAQGGGTKVLHTYKYSGEYAVVLNASAGGNEAVSRAEIKVFAPKINIGMEDGGGISLLNDSANEINIGGWKISSVSGTFVAAQDTIIGAGKKLVLPKAVTTVDFSRSVSVELLSPDGVIVARYAKPVITVASTTPITLATSAEIPAVQKESESVIAEIDAPLIIVPEPKAKMQAAAVAVVAPEKAASTPKQTIILKKPEGFFAKIWNFFF